MVTFIWHGVDVALGLASLKNDRSILNTTRLFFAFVGLVGNVAIASQEKGYWTNRHGR